jgi:hypothetical protein
MKRLFDRIIDLAIKIGVMILYSGSRFQLKRKVYTSKSGRIFDLVLGIVAFPVINGLIYLLLMLINRDLKNDLAKEYILMLPWIINGLLLVVALIFRPYMGLGYIVSFFGLMMLPIIAGIFLVAGCFVIIIVLIVVGIMEELSKNYPLLSSSPSLLVSILLFTLCLGGLTLSGWGSFIIFRRWLAKGK